MLLKCHNESPYSYLKQTKMSFVSKNEGQESKTDNTGREGGYKKRVKEGKYV
jgi:hypothetical protein